MIAIVVAVGVAGVTWFARAAGAGSRQVIEMGAIGAACTVAAAIAPVAYLAAAVAISAIAVAWSVPAR